MVTDAGALANYLTKVDGGWSTGHEIARPDVKSGHGTRTPWQLLDSAMLGSEHAQALWLVYERATLGRRRIDGTPGLLKELGVDELTDEDAAVGDDLEEPTVLVEIPAGDWHRMLVAGWAARVLDDVEALATGEVVQWPWPPEWLKRSP
jgi:hypothetical protein